MIQNSAAAEPFLPSKRTLPALRSAIKECRGCRLHCNATQAFFGEWKKEWTKRVD